MSATTSNSTQNVTAINEKIQFIKVELKKWETRFEEEHGRKPVKDDVLKDKDLAQRYKEYAKLKESIRSASKDKNQSDDIEEGDSSAATEKDIGTRLYEKHTFASMSKLRGSDSDLNGSSLSINSTQSNDRKGKRKPRNNNNRKARQTSRNSLRAESKDSLKKDEPKQSDKLAQAEKQKAEEKEPKVAPITKKESSSSIDGDKVAGSVAPYDMPPLKISESVATMNSTVSEQDQALSVQVKREPSVASVKTPTGNLPAYLAPPMNMSASVATFSEGIDYADEDEWPETAAEVQQPTEQPIEKTEETAKVETKQETPTIETKETVKNETQAKPEPDATISIISTQVVTETKLQSVPEHTALTDIKPTQIISAVPPRRRLLPSTADPSIFERIDRNEVLRCKVVRMYDGVDRMYPTFQLINEANNKVLLAARKRKKARNAHYLISNDTSDLTKKSKGYVGKLKADASGYAFTFMDARGYNPSAPNKGLKELASVVYDRGQLPRTMKVGLRPTSVKSSDVTNSLYYAYNMKENPSADMIMDLLNDNTERITTLTSKAPKQNPQTKAFSLNFGGRVSMASVKNFQLCRKGQERIMLQFGRIGKDSFILDARYPFTPLEAFAIGLTSFEAYENA